jgi:hypothetical protein
MKRIRIVGLALVAVFAMGVSTSAAFGAGSEFQAGTGKEAKGTTFTGSGGVATFQATGGSKITCEKSTSSGEIEGPFKAHVTVTYTGKCKLEGENAGECEKGEVKTEPLTVQPGDDIGGGGLGKEAGLRFSPKSGTVLAKPKCGALKVTIEVKGHLVCETKEAGILKETGEAVCAEKENAKKEVEKGIQKFTQISIEGGAPLTGQELTATAPFKETEKEAQITTEKLKFSQPIKQTL